MRRRLWKDNSTYAPAKNRAEINFCPSQGVVLMNSKSHLIARKVSTTNHILQNGIRYTLQCNKVGRLFRPLSSRISNFICRIDPERERDTQTKNQGKTYLFECRTTGEIIMTLFLRKGDRRYGPRKRWIFLASTQFYKERSRYYERQRQYWKLRLKYNVGNVKSTL